MKKTALIMVLLAGGMLRTAAAATHELKAPAETLEITLEPQDPPAQVVLKDWFCEYFDDAEDQLDAKKRADLITTEEVKRRMDPQGGPADDIWRFFVYSEFNWGNQPREIFLSLVDSELKPGRVLKGLDAPAGQTKVYHKKNCYTEKDVWNFIYSVANIVRERLVEIVDVYKKPPYNLTDEEIQHQRWYKPIPPKYDAEPVKTHVLTVKVSRKGEKEKKTADGGKSAADDSKSKTEPLWLRTEPFSDSFAGKGDRLLGPYWVGPGTFHFHVRAKTTCQICKFSVYIEKDDNNDGQYNAMGDEYLGGWVVNKGYKDILKLDLSQDVVVKQAGRIRFPVDTDDGVQWEVNVSYTPAGQTGSPSK